MCYSLYNFIKISIEIVTWKILRKIFLFFEPGKEGLRSSIISLGLGLTFCERLVHKWKTREVKTGPPAVTHFSKSQLQNMIISY
jgi:hypothetical protein